MAAVFENTDLVAIVLQHADLEPAAFVTVARVTKAWHAACCADESLLLAAARRPDFLTKRTLMGRSVCVCFVCVCHRVGAR